MRLLSRRPHFRTLIAASTVSLIGDFLSFVGLAALSLVADQGFLGIAIVFAAHALPKVMLAPFAGLVADRYEKRAVMLTANVVQALLTLGMAWAVYAHEHATLRALVFIRSAVSAFHTPAEAAAVPRLLPRDELVLGNALMATSWGTSMVLGMALGGFVAMLGPTLSMLVDAGTFVLASALLATLPALPSSPEDKADAHVVRATRDALRSIADVPHLLRAFFAKSAAAVPSGMAFVLLHAVVLARASAEEMPLLLGVLQALRGLGTLVGPFTTSVLASRGVSLARSLGVADALVLAATAAMLLPSTFALALTSLALGIGQGTNWMVSTAVIQRDAHVAFQGRLAALDELAWTSVYAVAAFITAVAFDGGVAASWMTLVFVLLGAVFSAGLALFSPALEPRDATPQAASSSVSA